MTVGRRKNLSESRNLIHILVLGGLTPPLATLRAALRYPRTSSSFLLLNVLLWTSASPFLFPSLVIGAGDQESDVLKGKRDV